MRIDGGRRGAVPNFDDGLGGEHIARAMGAAHGDPEEAMLILARTGHLPVQVPQRIARPSRDPKGEPAFPVMLLPAGLPGCEKSIPRTIHLAWLGQKALTALNHLCVQSWMELHPTWDFVFWADAQSTNSLGFLPKEQVRRVEEIAPITGGLMAASENFGARTDILRLELLRLHGGVWVDFDVECLRPIDELLVNGGAFVGAGTHPGYLQIENAVLGCCAGHPLVEASLRTLPWWLGLCPLTDTIYKAGPVYLHYWCQLFMGDGFEPRYRGKPVTANSVTVYPRSYWYQEEGVKNARESGAYGYHHWTGAWYV